MRIALDASPLDRRIATGVEKSFLRLLHGLAGDAADHEYLLVAPRRPELLPELRDARFEFHDLEHRGRWWRERAAPRFARRAGVELWHSPVQAIPLRLGLPRVATLHELSWTETDGVEDEGPLRRRRAVTWAVARAAERIVCVSESTRRRLLELHPAAAERAVVVPHGIPRECFEPPAERGALLERYRLSASRPFFLTLGRALKRKGLGAAVRAFQAFLAVTGAPHELVLAGPENEQLRAALRDAASLGLAERVRAPGFIAEEDLSGLYAAAGALLMPSESEGFGLPVLEAMAAGTPVVASARASLPEVAGDAALLVDFGNAAEAARAMQRAIGPERDEWIRRGRRRAQDFPMEQTVSLTLAVWQELAA